MSTDDADALLAEVVSGERATADPAVQQLLAARPELRAQLERLRRLADGFDDLGAHDRAFLAEAAAAPPGQVPESRRTPFRRRPLLLLAAAAAAAVVLFFWLDRRTPTPGNKDHRLGGQPRTEVEPAPVGTVPAIDQFTWQLTLPREGRYQLSVCSVEADGSPGRRLFEPVTVRVPQWTPDPERRARFAERMLWRAVALDQTGGVAGSTPWYEVVLVR